MLKVESCFQVNPHHLTMEPFLIFRTCNCENIGVFFFACCINCPSLEFQVVSLVVLMAGGKKKDE